MTTESLMIHAIKRGLLLADFQELSVGMILEYVNQYDSMCNDHRDEGIYTKHAGQSEFDSF